MNTDPKNNNPFRAPSHPELGPDTNPSTEYQVKFVLREDYSLVMTVEANSQAEAEEKALEHSRRPPTEQTPAGEALAKGPGVADAAGL